MVMMYRDYDLPERPLEPPEPTGLTCYECGCSLSDNVNWNRYIVWNGENLCLDCARDSVVSTLREPDEFSFYLSELAEMMKFEVTLL